MNKVLRLNMGAGNGIVEFLRYLLKNDKVGGIFTLTETNENHSYSYALITDADELDTAVPLAPIMPVNAGQVLSSLTPTKKPIAAVLKPCEYRAFIELVKRERGSLENILIISYTCSGVFPLKTIIDGEKEKLISDYFKTVGNGDISEMVRPTCKACEYFVPVNADITISLIGEKNLDSECRLFLNTERARGFADGFEGDISEADIDAPVIETLLAKRKEEKEKLFQQIGLKKNGLNDLIHIFGKCVGCHGCSHVCPICYCVLCDFESFNYDYEVSLYEKELSQKGALRLPPDTVFFHIGRIVHMSFSCVGCGLCTDICPADIPVSSIFMKTGEETAAIFDYVPGRDTEEAIPVAVFKEEELSEFGE